MIEARTDTDGLASAYQLTQVTAGGTPVLETGGRLLIGIITLPYRETISLTPTPSEPSITQIEKELESAHNRLAREMTQNRAFLELVERGMVELEQRQYHQHSEAKSRRM